jgi:hypothetical protein
MHRSACAVLLLLCSVSAIPMGLFVDTSSFGDGSSAYAQQVTSALTLACRSFNASTSPHRVTSLALDHLAGRDGAYLGDAVAGLAPFFGCFETVYVGTADNHKAPDMYCGALLNATFIDDYVARSLAVAARFAADYPPATLPNLRWYLNYEAAGNYFGTGCDRFEVAQPTAPLPPHPAVSAEAFTEAYADMFRRLTQGLTALRDTGGAMWSPTFNWQARFVEEQLGNRPALLGNLTALLRAVPLLREIANQDAVGKYALYDVSSGSFSYNLTCVDTIFYQALLTEAAAAAAAAGSPVTRVPVAVSVNMELFTRRNTVPASTIAGDPAEHEARKCCYAAHNLSIGPSWEVGDWWRSQFVEWNPAAPGARTTPRRREL